MTKEMGFIILFLLIVLLSPLLSIENIRRIIRIYRTTTYWISTLPSEGQVCVIGKAKGEPIQSPLSKKECLLWAVEVEEDQGKSRNSSWKTVYEKTSESAFEVYDKNGGIPILIKDVDLDVYKNEYTKAIFDSMKPDIEKLGVKTKGFLGIDKILRATEHLVNPDDTVFILGDIEYKDGRKTIASSAARPLLISNRSKQELLSNLYRRVVQTTILVVLGGVIILLIGFNS
jgi:hypothetical protein